MSSPVDRAYQDFANAIVARAADDYRRALNGVGYNKKSPEQVIEEVEEFFYSHYFKILTRADPNYLIERLQQEHEENERRKYESNTNTSDA